ncbi:hypothetical protein NE237_029213 [Protea cynaroides]|uniref:Transmembrane protein n=1 Tax=Protea cynaroides TaxID=273540 RepID=A0A9Q0JUJ5_9MAGN|nr:hypothetical protein NE237_029213 [Protea cynaroides]
MQLENDINQKKQQQGPGDRRPQKLSRVFVKWKVSHKLVRCGGEYGSLVRQGQMFRIRFVSAFFLFISLLFSSQLLNTFALHGITKPKNGDFAAHVHLGRQPSGVSIAAVPEKDPKNAGRSIDAQKLVIHQKIVKIPRGRGIVGGHTSTSDASVALISSLHLWFIVASLVYLNFL